MQNHNASIAQTTESGNIDQLWYTWSTVGLESLGGEFVIRAATPAFKADPYGKRMHSLQSYLLYKLPQGTDRFELAMALEQAPISLTFDKTEMGEKVLAYKVYTGRDGYNRQGVHFVHLLAGLPDHFSVEDAISLWRSQFWQTCDLPASRQGVDLNPVDIRDLRACEKPIPLLQTTLLNSQKVNIKRVYANLPQVINAYLAQVTKLGLLSRESTTAKALQLVEPKMESKKQSRAKVTRTLSSSHYPDPFSTPAQPQIYLVAPPDEVAFYVAALTKKQAKLLLTPLTFSTYEHDVRSKSQCFIVGTCPEPSLAQIDHVEKNTEAYYRLSKLLPRSLPPEAITINCYTQETSSFELPPYAKYFVEYICQKIFKELPTGDTNGTSPASLTDPTFANASLMPISDAQETEEDDDVEEFLREMDQRSELSMPFFLDRFYHQIINQTYSQADCEEFLISVGNILRRFKKSIVCEQFVQHLANDPAWIERALQPLLENAFDLSVQNRQLLSVLSNLVREVWQVASDAIQQSSVDRFQGPITFLLLAAAHNPALVYGDAVRQCLAQANNSLFSEWNPRSKLLLQAAPLAQALRGTSLIDPLLEVEERHFASLLALKLPAEWNRRATYYFLATTSSGARPQTITSLEAAFSYVQALVQQLHTDCGDRDLAHRFYCHLVGNGLSSGHKMALLLQTWFVLPLTKVELDSLLLSDDVSRLDTHERARILTQYGFDYLCQPEFSDIMLALYERVVRAPDGEAIYKTSLLPALVGCGAKQHILLSEPVLTSLLAIAHLHNQAEAIFFFNQCELNLPRGSSYIELYPNLEPLIYFYEKAAEKYEKSIDLLDRWFQARSLTSATAGRLLRASSLSLSAKDALIKAHAARFRSSELFGLIIQLFAEVAQDDYKNIYLWQLLDLLLKLGLQSKDLERILSAANLKQGTRVTIVIQLFQAYGRVLLPALYLSPTALDLFSWSPVQARLVDDEEAILQAWFSDVLGVNNKGNIVKIVEKILENSSLKKGQGNDVQEQHVINLRTRIFREFGEELLIRCSASTALQVQIKQYLRYVDPTRLVSAPHLNRDALFLDKLNAEASRLSADVQSLLQCWLHVRDVLNRPSIEYIYTNEQSKNLAATFYTLVIEYKLPDETRVLLIRTLAEAFSTLRCDSEHLLLCLASILASFPLNERFQFFYLMADVTRQEFKKKRQNNILIPYIKMPPNLDLYPRPAIEQDELQRFTHILWRHLLTPEGYEALKQAAQTQNWGQRVQDAWNEYVETVEREQREREQKERKLYPVAVPTSTSLPVAQALPAVPLGQSTSVQYPNIASSAPAQQPAPGNPPAPQRSLPILTPLKASVNKGTIDKMQKLLAKPGMRKIARYRKRHQEAITRYQEQFTSEQWNHICLATDFDLLCKKVDKYNPPRREDVEELVQWKEFIQHIFSGISLPQILTQAELDLIGRAEHHLMQQKGSQSTSASYYGSNFSEGRKAPGSWISNDEVSNKKGKKR